MSREQLEPSICDVTRQPPLTPFSGPLKQINLGALRLLERTALNFAFPLFLGRHPSVASPQNLFEEELRRSRIPGDRHVSPYCRRRYSGDSSEDFPRCRYYSLCRDDKGTDNRTLVSELSAYALPRMTGYCAARTGRTANEIELVFRGLPDEPNPLYLGLSNPDAFEHVFSGMPNMNPLREASGIAGVASQVGDATEVVLPVTCLVQSYEIPRCLDLRQPEARRWVVEFFADPPQGKYGDALRLLAKAHLIDLRRVRDWVGVAPVLNARTMGGNPLTDMLGTYLRQAGCQALIYPSARNDYGALYMNGTLKDFFGWNLVDYRNAAAPKKVGIDLGDPIEALEGQNIIREIGDGPNAGSIAFVGNQLFNRVRNHALYDRRIRMVGSEWRLKHIGQELFVRGYLWYRQRYSLADRSFSAICDQCNARWVDDRVQLVPQCPSCGYLGDL